VAQEALLQTNGTSFTFLGFTHIWGKSRAGKRRSLPDLPNALNPPILCSYCAPPQLVLSAPSEAGCARRPARLRTRPRLTRKQTPWVGAVALVGAGLPRREDFCNDPRSVNNSRVIRGVPVTRERVTGRLSYTEPQERLRPGGLRSLTRLLRRCRGRLAKGSALARVQHPPHIPAAQLDTARDVERLEWHVRRERVSETPLQTGASFESEPLPVFRLLTTIPH
jgi:hypothetical protein